ncbi:outer membrane protein OmpK [Paludibacterium paludis]|uniref:Ion channel protein Tsx n=1 Tax=Paludibacterium paludis TaxID=1225769 RepID=A0A918NZY6_9NEIS|nr:outer membrane protein OmpK [Paludibacterium paludis]GGY09084.1 ion channel protein Tsx [Paludibacterium paludis]
MNTSKLLLAVTLAGTVAAAQADGYSFANVSANYLDWSNNTTRISNGGKQDFGYLEAEGGMGGNWGDLYGFFDIENPGQSNQNTKPGKDRRWTTKVVGRYNLTTVANVPVQLYAHVYDTRGHNFYDQNRVLGLGTSLSFGKLWIKPFIGVHQELNYWNTARHNGYMAGYVAGYDFTAFGQPFSITQWHETEFDRNSRFSQLSTDGNVHERKSGQNGAISLWWTPVKSVTTGIQYRYALHKLGVAGNENAMIYTIKYNF